jgi:hypothetical protein
MQKKAQGRPLVAEGRQPSRSTKRVNILILILPEGNACL